MCVPRTPPACEISMVPRAILRTLTGRWPVLLCLPTHLVITEFVHPRSVLLCLLTDYVITEFAHFRPVLLCLPTHCVIAEFARQRRAGVCSRMGLFIHLKNLPSRQEIPLAHCVRSGMVRPSGGNRGRWAARKKIPATARSNPPPISFSSLRLRRTIPRNATALSGISG